MKRRQRHALITKATAQRLAWMLTTALAATTYVIVFQHTSIPTSWLA